MSSTLYLYKGALTLDGYNHIQVVLPLMSEAGLPWLAEILDTMSHGDPWQDGAHALSIVQAWESNKEGAWA